MTRIPWKEGLASREPWGIAPLTFAYRTTSPMTGGLSHKRFHAPGVYLLVTGSSSDHATLYPSA